MWFIESCLAVRVSVSNLVVGVVLDCYAPSINSQDHVVIAPWIAASGRRIFAKPTVDYEE